MDSICWKVNEEKNRLGWGNFLVLATPLAFQNFLGLKDQAILKFHYDQYIPA